MPRGQINQGENVIEQFLRVLNLSQGALAREWGCTKDKINRAANGGEPTFTAQEIQNIEAWLRDKFNRGWLDLPSSFRSKKPIDFLVEFEQQQQTAD